VLRSAAAVQRVDIKVRLVPELIFESVHSRTGGVRPTRSSSEGEIVQTGDAAHSVVNAVAPETAVAQDLPGLHAGQGGLDAGADPFVQLCSERPTSLRRLTVRSSGALR